MVGTHNRFWDKRKCTKCVFYYEEWEGEYSSTYLTGTWCTFDDPKRHHYGNLKSWPFKNGCSEFVVDFWFSEHLAKLGDDVCEESIDKAMREYGRDPNPKLIEETEGDDAE